MREVECILNTLSDFVRQSTCEYEDKGAKVSLGTYVPLCNPDGFEGNCRTCFLSTADMPRDILQQENIIGLQPSKQS